jgi:NADH:ubiquinone oxidoreductase subunit 6 (subunit J)
MPAVATVHTIQLLIFGGSALLAAGLVLMIREKKIALPNVLFLISCLVVIDALFYLLGLRVSHAPLLKDVAVLLIAVVIGVYFSSRNNKLDFKKLWKESVDKVLKRRGLS